MTIDTTEVIGFIGSAVVLISFLFKDIKYLRVINTIGCGIFIAYGFMLQTSWPIVFTNVCIVVINSYFLLKAGK
jgi:hypothetical protein